MVSLLLPSFVPTISPRSRLADLVALDPQGALSNWGNLPTAIVQSVAAAAPFDPATDPALGTGESWKTTRKRELDRANTDADLSLSVFSQDTSPSSSSPTILPSSPVSIESVDGISSTNRRRDLQKRFARSGLVGDDGSTRS